MAERVKASWTQAPHFYLHRQVNAQWLVSWKRQLRERDIGGVTFTDLLIWLLSRALWEHPRVNAVWGDEDIIIKGDINIGIAVAVEDGLVVPVIHKADQSNLRQLVHRRKQLVRRAQEGNLSLEDLQGGTFTISNLGMHGVDVFDAVVNPPQAAILAVGRIADRVVADGGRAVVRPTMILSLSFDHRVIDGARGAQFLDTLANYVEAPLQLME
jgi:pyruvate dehydrogenase E2 component (dihydrolipoamide acetyltransferase)